MATETWVLDSVPLNSGNFTMLELTTDPPEQRPEWISAADSEAAALVRQPLHENRTITMKLRVAPQASMNAALDQVGVIVDKFVLASETGDGIALVWTPANSSRSVTFDVLAGTITELPIANDGQGRSWLTSRPLFTVEMKCKPYWRGTETLTSTASSSTPITTLEITGVTGDVPALGRLIVTDTATQSRRHLEWGLEAQYYDPATSLIIDSDSMTVSGFAGVQTAGSGYDPNAAGTNVVRATIYNPPLAVCGTGNMSHIGRFRVKARISPSAAVVGVRLAWQASDGPFSRNDWAFVDGATPGFSEVDLGMIHIPPVLSGTQRWRGTVEAYSTTDAATVDIDYLLLIPVEGYGKARASIGPTVGTANGLDRFKSTTAGNALNARVAPLGGTWATSGATTDYTFSDAWVISPLDTESVTRATSSDAGFGRFAALSATNYTDIEIQVAATVDQPTGTPSGDVDLGVFARFVDANNFLSSYLYWKQAASAWQFRTNLIVAGAVAFAKETPISVDPVGGGFRVWLLVYASGAYFTAAMHPNNSIIASFQGRDTRLATGGTHATGTRGIRDRSLGVTIPQQRFYSQFYSAVPDPEPFVLYSGRIFQARHDDTIRQDSTGTYYGRPQSYNGSRFLVPPGTSRVVAKARRSDADTDVDANVTDATQIQVGWTPRGLAVPR